MVYINLFFVYSFIGHLLEKTLYPEEVSGILVGYLTPIYGIGCLFILFLFNKFISKLKINNILKIFITFVVCAFSLAFIEYIGGICIEKIFGYSFWDYSGMKFNIGKYTSLEMALVWGFAGIGVIYIINPILEKIVKMIPKYITILACFLLLIDILFIFLPKIK